MASVTYPKRCLVIAGGEQDNGYFPGGVVHIHYEVILAES